MYTSIANDPEFERRRKMLQEESMRRKLEQKVPEPTYSQKVDAKVNELNSSNKPSGTKPPSNEQMFANRMKQEALERSKFNSMPKQTAYQEEFKPVDNSMSEAMNAKFNLLEKKGIAQSRQQTGMEQDVISRRMASIGSLGSGTNIKLQQQALREGANREQGVRESVDAMRLEDQANRDQQSKSMNFQRQERISGQKYGSSERVSGQEFAGQQAQIERDWNRLANTDQRNWTAQQTELDRVYKQKMFDREFARQMIIDEHNMKMAQKQMEQNDRSWFEELTGIG